MEVDQSDWTLQQEDTNYNEEEEVVMVTNYMTDETMIENAYFYSNPPDATQTARTERPPMHNYIRRLLYKDLSKVTTEKVS